MFAPHASRAEDALQRACALHDTALLAAALLVAVLLRCCVAVFPYSGEGVPPMHGDYEAQRHWMEITTGLEASGWYTNSTQNDLLYWGLDYPPLTAYHSWLLGKAGHYFVPECFALQTSRGHESAKCRLFMRASVILSDLLVYLPGSFFAVRSLSSDQERPSVRFLATLGLWCLPPLLLIDHGHFQYNGVCFGLCLAAAGCVARGRALLASLLFTAGLLFKQIALYYAPAFFFGILADCLLTTKGREVTVATVKKVAVVGGVVLGTAGVLFAPWLLSARPAAAVGQVLHRMFPFARGLYEDKVANVWCSMSVVLKLHKIMPAKRIPLFCALATLVNLLPACSWCLRSDAGKVQPGHGRGATFLVALAVSALSFFLFAFQVHEKAILFPCVAICLLPLALGPARRPPWLPVVLAHFLLVCMFSMYPLVVKDKLQVAYVLLCAPLVLLCEALPATALLRIGLRASLALALVIHAVHALVPAPRKYPDIWTLLITATSCGYFLLCLAGLTRVQRLGALDLSAGRKED